VFASTHEGVIITDRDARILAANPAFTTITGYEESEVVGSDPRVLQSGVQSRDWYRNSGAPFMMRAAGRVKSGIEERAARPIRSG
jgi:PAS domain-containing protein